MARTLIRATRTKINNNPLGMAMLHHGMSCTAQRPREGGERLQPTEVVHRGTPGLRCGHIKGGDLFKIMIK